MKKVKEVKPVLEEEVVEDSETKSVQKVNTRLPKGITQDEVDKLKSVHGHIFMSNFAHLRVIYRGYVHGEIDENKIKNNEEIIKLCTLFVEGNLSIDKMTDPMKEGLLNEIQRASGAPAVRYSFLWTDESQKDNPDLFEEFKKADPSAARALNKCVEEHGAAIVTVCRSDFRKFLSVVWIFPPITEIPSDLEDDPEKLLAHVLANHLYYPEPVHNPGALLGMHYQELVQAVNGVLGYVPTGEAIDL